MFTDFSHHSYVPSIWKKSIILPLYKNQGPKDLISNYRPIALNCTLAKVFERVILYFLDSSLEGQLSSRQHGFKKSRSTLTNMLESYSEIYMAVNVGNSVDMITIDLSKAFDKVVHSLLLQKLVDKRVSPTIINLLASYLSDRKQLVIVEGQCSGLVDVMSGVTQGSILSPLLFSVFIDDLLSLPFVNKVVVYADDIKLIGSPGQSQQDLDLIVCWTKNNSMTINGQKSECIHFGSGNPSISYTIDQSPIPVVETRRDLGLIIDKRLNFYKHCQNVSSNPQINWSVFPLLSHSKRGAPN